MLRDMLRRLISRHGFSDHLETLYHGGENTYRARCTPIKIFRRVNDHFPGCNVMLVGRNDDAIDCRITNPTPWVIDHTLHRFLVIRVKSEPEIGDQVLYFLTLVKRQAAIYLIRYIQLTQSLFH